MDNCEIVDIVFKEYNIKKLINKLIQNGTGLEDLEQFIYIILIEMNNNLLNKLFKTGHLKRYITRIILNQRNYPKNGGTYNKEFKITSVDRIVEQPDEILHDFRIDYLYYELERIPFGTTGLTQTQLRKIFGYAILEHYIKTGESMLKVSKKFNICRSTTRTLINEAKKNIKKEYDRNFNSWIDDSGFDCLGGFGS